MSTSLARTLVQVTKQATCSARCFSTTATPSYPPTATPSPSSSSSSSAPPPPAPRSSAPTGSRLYSPPTASLLSFTEQLLAPLSLRTPLPEHVVEQALTHKSAVNKGRNLSLGEGEDRQQRKQNHGERLGFVGRRVLRLHYTLHLTSALAGHPTLAAQYLAQAAVDSAFETRELGANVGRAWGLEKVVRWREVRGPKGEMTGLYKSRGAAVEALVGAVYTQAGIAASHAMFHQLVLPHLDLPAGLRRGLEGRE